MKIPEKLKTAILGGSFNPVHTGHLLLAESVVRQTGYERILFVPAADPPHKELAPGADSADRLQMLKIATEDLPWADCWDGELRREGPSFSLDTVRALLSEKIITGKPGMVIGADLISGIHRWHRIEELKESVQFVVAMRQTVDQPEFPYPCLFLNNSLWPFSSSQIRQLVAENSPIEHAVPESVAAYIRDKRLYLP